MLYDIILTLFTRVFSKKIKIGIGALINKETMAEGKNVIGRFSTAKSTIIGFGSYISNNCNLSSTRIGRYVSVGDRVKVVSGIHPTNQNISTHPAFYAVNNVPGISYVKTNYFNETKYAMDGFAVNIGNDVWIGSDVRILGGIQIGDGAIIACGAVVINDVPPYSIIGGVPARVLKYRFSLDEIHVLMKIKWWEWNTHKIHENADLFSEPAKFIKYFQE